MKRCVPGQWFPVRGEPALSISWASVVRRRDAIQKHFGMTVERAAETGGLDWQQLWRVFFETDVPETVDAARRGVLHQIKLEHAAGQDR